MPAGMRGENFAVPLSFIAQTGLFTLAKRRASASPALPDALFAPLHRAACSRRPPLSWQSCGAYSFRSTRYVVYSHFSRLCPWCQDSLKTSQFLACRITIHLGQVNKKRMKDRAKSVKVELPHNNLTKGGHILHEQEYNTGHGVQAILNEIRGEIRRQPCQ